MPGRKLSARLARHATVAWAIAVVLAVALTLMLLERPAHPALACVDQEPLVAV